jgi:hypothetical protein
MSFNSSGWREEKKTGWPALTPDLARADDADLRLAAPGLRPHRRGQKSQHQRATRPEQGAAPVDQIVQGHGKPPRMVHATNATV